MIKRVKKKDYENLTSSNIEKVIALLNPGSDTDKPITKKQACDVLNIAYNTARLQTEKPIQKNERSLCGVVRRLLKKSLKRAQVSSEEILSQISPRDYSGLPLSYETFLRQWEYRQDQQTKKKE